jgi:hypothetical protein|tara:strand:+ start:305 stop:580 length:276 start_codon:yes stop_codon:yes gene_type:complete
MKIVALIKTVLQTLNLYLKLKNRSFYVDLVEKSKKKQKDLIDEIEKLRSDGDSDATDRADFLFRELVAEKRDIKHLSAINSITSEGSTSSD